MMQKALWAKPPELFFNGYLSFHIFNLHLNRYVFGPCRISTLSERHVEWAWQCSNVWRSQDSICCSNQGWWSSGLDQRCKFFVCQRCRVNEHKTCYLLLYVRLICCYVWFSAIWSTTNLVPTAAHVTTRCAPSRSRSPWMVLSTLRRVFDARLFSTAWRHVSDDVTSRRRLYDTTWMIMTLSGLWLCWPYCDCLGG